MCLGKVEYPTKSDDFFPYASSADSYWTGAVGPINLWNIKNILMQDYSYVMLL